jgi:hypothetical protein
MTWTSRSATASTFKKRGLPGHTFETPEGEANQSWAERFGGLAGVVDVLDPVEPRGPGARHRRRGGGLHRLARPEAPGRDRSGARRKDVRWLVNIPSRRSSRTRPPSRSSRSRPERPMPIVIMKAWITQRTSTTSTAFGVQLRRKTAAATVSTAANNTDVRRLDPGDSASSLQLGTALSGFTASAEGTDGEIIVEEGSNILNGWYYEPQPELAPHRARRRHHRAEAGDGDHRHRPGRHPVRRRALGLAMIARMARNPRGLFVPRAGLDRVAARTVGLRTCYLNRASMARV